MQYEQQPSSFTSAQRRIKMNIQEIYDWAKSNNVLDSEIYIDDNTGIIPLIEVFISKRNDKKIIVIEGLSWNYEI